MIEIQGNPFNVTSPDDMIVNQNEILTEIIGKFEKQFTGKKRGEDHYHLTINGEYSDVMYEKIKQVYLAAGWSKVKCKKSPIPGLTNLNLWR